METAEHYQESSVASRFAIVLGLGVAFVLSLGATSLFFGYVIKVTFRLLQL
jgi:hypothetical protein